MFSGVSRQVSHPPGMSTAIVKKYTLLEMIHLENSATFAQLQLIEVNMFRERKKRSFP